MRIKVLINLGTSEYGNEAVPAGVHDLGEPLAARIIAKGHGVAMAEPKAAKVESPPEPEATTAKMVAAEAPPAGRPAPLTFRGKQSHKQPSNKDK